jgi:hypothetical protein
MKKKQVTRLLAYGAATVNQQLLPLLTDPQQSALVNVPTNTGLELVN